MLLINFPEKEILSRYQSGSHLGQGIERLTFKTVHCTKDFEYQGKLIYKERGVYKLWIVKYKDILTGTHMWFTAQPMVAEQDGFELKRFYMVPVETFQYAGDSIDKAPFYELENTADGQQKMRFQLFVDINDGMQKLIEPWSLEKSKVIEHAVAVKGGSKADYTIRGRLVTNPAESHIVWLLRRRLGKKQYADLFFDVLEQRFIDWQMYAPDAKMLPISSGQAMVHIGHNTIRADKYRFIYTLGK